MDEKNLSVNRLAKAVSCDNQAIARWLDGRYYPRHYMLIKLANYFHCSVDYLLGLTDDDRDVKTNENITIDFKVQFIHRKQALDLTDYQIAKQLEIEQSTISKWLLRNQVPETNTLIRLSALFNCSVEYLLGRAELN